MNEEKTPRGIGEHSARWLFIEPGRIGDWVMANAAVRLFLDEHGGTIDWAVRSELGPLLKCGVPYDQAMYIPGKMTLLKAIGLAFACFRRQTRYDGCCILTPGKSGYLVHKFVKAATKFGYTEWGSGQGVSLEGQPIAYKPDQDHLFPRVLQTCISRPRPVSYPDFIRDKKYIPSLAVLQEDVQAIDRILSAWGIDGDFVAVNMGARSVFRRWPIEHWSQLITMLLDQDVPVVIAGSPGEHEAALQLKDAINRKDIFVLEPCPLNQYAAFLSKSRVLVCHDSGPMHLAPAVGTRVVAIYGPSDPALTAPVCEESKLKIVQCNPALTCQPCITPSTPNTVDLPCDEAGKCMRELSVTAVYEAIGAF